MMLTVLLLHRPENGPRMACIPPGHCSLSLPSCLFNTLPSVDYPEQKVAADAHFFVLYLVAYCIPHSIYDYSAP